MGVKIRKARETDEPRLAWVARQAWSPKSSPGPAPAEGAPFLSEIVHPENVLVAAQDGLAVGYARLVRLSESQPRLAPAADHVQEIYGFAVAPDCQGRGIGRLMLEAVRTEALRRNALRVTLRVLSTNERALRLYRTAGYTVEGTLHGEFYIRGRFVDDVLMALDLSA